MNSIADMGGMHGFGPIERDKPSDPIFASRWEAETFAVNILALAGGCFNIDASRHSIERMSAIDYLSTSYYEHWLHAMEDVLVAEGVFTAEEYAQTLAAITQGKEG